MATFHAEVETVGKQGGDVALTGVLYIHKTIRHYTTHNSDHVLHRLLPPVAHTSHNYVLRPRAHDRSLPD